MRSAMSGAKYSTHPFYIERDRKFCSPSLVASNRACCAASAVSTLSFIMNLTRGTKSPEVCETLSHSSDSLRLGAHKTETCAAEDIKHPNRGNSRFHSFSNRRVRAPRLRCLRHGIGRSERAANAGSHHRLFGLHIPCRRPPSKAAPAAAHAPAAANCPCARSHG